MNRGRPWTASDRTGGLLDELFDELRRRIPWVVVERLVVTHAADDDNVYFIGDEHGLDRIQLDTNSDGQTFYLENGGRYPPTTEVSEAVAIIASFLQQSRRPESAGPAQ